MEEKCKLFQKKFKGHKISTYSLHMFYKKAGIKRKVVVEMKKAVEE